MLPYLIAASPSLLFGTFSLILGRWQGDDRQKVFGIFAGAFLTALVATPFLGAKWSPQIVISTICSAPPLAPVKHQTVPQHRPYSAPASAPQSIATQAMQTGRMLSLTSKNRALPNTTVCRTVSSRKNAP